MLAVARAAAKIAVHRCLGSGPVIERKLRAITARGALTILNLHRVAPDDQSSYRPLDPGMFEQLLLFAKTHFEIVTFGDLGKAPAGKRPRLILSFDDGYADFFQFAAPLLAKHGIRVNHNIVPECVESGRPPLNVVLQDFIGRASQSALDAFEVPGFPRARAGETREQLGARLSNFVKGKSQQDQSELAASLLPQLEQQPDFRPTAMMTLDELREIAAVHEVGAHSFAHASLAYESDEFLRDDIKRCRAWMADRLGQEMSIYAVPNGSYRPGQVEVLRDSGIDHVLLVEEDFSSEQRHVHKRFTFDARTAAEVRFRTMGGFRWPKGGGALQ